MNSKCSAAVFALALMVATALPLGHPVSAAPDAHRILLAQNNDGPPPFAPPIGADNPESGAFPGSPDAQDHNSQQWNQPWKQHWKRKRQLMQGGPGDGIPGQGHEPGMILGGGSGQHGMPGGGMRRGPGGGFGGRGFGAGMGKGNGRFQASGHRLDLTPLNLTDQQKSRIQALHEQARGQAKEIRKRLGMKQMKLRELLFSPDATDAQILTARRDMRDLQDKMDELNVKDVLAIRGVLTPEQKAKLPLIMPGRRETAGGGMPGGHLPGVPMLGGGQAGFGQGENGPAALGPRAQKIIEMRARAKMAGQSGPPQD